MSLISEKLTGRRRYRSEQEWIPGVFGVRRGRQLLVVQVEVQGRRTFCLGGYVDSETGTWWRDAKPEDFTVGGSEGGL